MCPRACWWKRTPGNQNEFIWPMSYIPIRSRWLAIEVMKLTNVIRVTSQHKILYAVNLDPTRFDYTTHAFILWRILMLFEWRKITGVSVEEGIPSLALSWLLNPQPASLWDLHDQGKYTGLIRALSDRCPTVRLISFCKLLSTNSENGAVLASGCSANDTKVALCIVRNYVSVTI